MAEEAARRPRILLVQFAGDFRAAHRLLAKGGAETYYGHRYLLESLATIQAELGETAILCCLSGERYTEVLPSGVTVIGADAHPQKRWPEVQAAIEAFGPTHLVLLTPVPRLLRWARRSSGARVMCMFADSFDMGAALRWWRFGRLAAQLADPVIELVANHGRNACRSLVRLGVDPAKIVAWDWPQTRRPRDLPPRQAPVAGAALFFAGEMVTSKGLGDAIDAVAELKRRGRDVSLQIAGRGQVDRFRRRARRRGVADRIEWLGVIPNPEVLTRMRAAAIVLVPSRHRYPEGMPLTIYEALCARTPLVVSDHPMFLGNLVDGESALVFPAGRAMAMADAIERLLADRALYAALSANGEAAWERLQLPVRWGELIHRWLRDGAEDRRWIADHRFAAQGG